MVASKSTFYLRPPHDQTGWLFQVPTAPFEVQPWSVTLNPATDEATVLVAAKQTLNGGPTITVKSLVATVNNAVPSGDYEYNLTLLPIGAPSHGPYVTPLPIVFTQQPAGVASRYIVQASAMDYVTQSVNGDISAADTIQNFILVP